MLQLFDLSRDRDDLESTTYARFDCSNAGLCQYWRIAETGWVICTDAGVVFAGVDDVVLDASGSSSSVMSDIERSC